MSFSARKFDKEKGYYYAVTGDQPKYEPDFYKRDWPYDKDPKPNPDYDPNDPETGSPTITVAVYPVDENGDPVPAHIDNPVTKGDFTHKMVRRFLSQHVTQHETALARAQALTGLDTTVDLGDPG